MHHYPPLYALGTWTGEMDMGVIFLSIGGNVLTL